VSTKLIACSLRAGPQLVLVAGRSDLHGYASSFAGAGDNGGGLQQGARPAGRQPVFQPLVDLDSRRVLGYEATVGRERSRQPSGTRRHHPPRRVKVAVVVACLAL
jgi:hypothetical protein